MNEELRNIPIEPVLPEKEVQKPAEAELKKKTGIGRSLQSLLDGTFLTRENVIRLIPFFFFLAVLALIYINNTILAVKMVKNIDKAKIEIKELRNEHITTKAKLMYESKQSIIARRLQNTGIKPSITPPEKIVVSPEKDAKNDKSP